MLRRHFWAVLIALGFSMMGGRGLAQIELLNNGDFETGRGPAGEVDYPGGNYSAGWRNPVCSFVPGGPNDASQWGPQDWWWGDDARYMPGPDPTGPLNLTPPNEVIPYSGSKMLRFKGTGSRDGQGGDVFQDIDVTAHASVIDGGAFVYFSGYFTRIARDSGSTLNTVLQCFNAGKVFISNEQPPAYHIATPGEWQQETRNFSIPPGTRYIRFRVFAWGQSHYFHDSFGGSHWNTPYWGSYADFLSLQLIANVTVEGASNNGSIDLTLTGFPPGNHSVVYTDNGFTTSVLVIGDAPDLSFVPPLSGNPDDWPLPTVTTAQVGVVSSVSQAHVGISIPFTYNPPAITGTASPGSIQVGVANFPPGNIDVYYRPDGASSFMPVLTDVPGGSGFTPSPDDPTTTGQLAAFSTANPAIFAISAGDISYTP